MAGDRINVASDHFSVAMPKPRAGRRVRTQLRSEWTGIDDLSWSPQPLFIGSTRDALFGLGSGYRLVLNLHARKEADSRFACGPILVEKRQLSKRQ